MKVLSPIVILLIMSMTIFASNGNEILELKATIGFANGEDRIVKYNLIENERILLIGEKNIQIWDTRDFKLISSVPHQIPQFAPRGFFSTYILLGLPQLLDLWKPFVVDPKGKFIITAEKLGDNKLQTAVVRDLQTLKQIAILDLPDVSTEFVRFDETDNEIRTFGETGNVGAFADWDSNTFKLKKLVSVKDYKWHRMIKNDEKVIVGSGETKFSWTQLNSKQGENLTLREVKTGKVEKEFTAQNLTPRNTFRSTSLSKDEKFLISTREDRIFVWKIDGDGTPRFEVSSGFDNKEYDLVKVIGGKYLAVSVNKKLQFYDITGKGDLKFELVSSDPNDTVNLFDQTEDGRYVAVADDSKISVLETGGDGNPTYVIDRENEKERFTLIKFLEDRNILAVGRVNRSEKKPERTEFYDIETGKMISVAPIGFSRSVAFTSDKDFLYDTDLGRSAIWDFTNRTFFFVPLKAYEPEYDADQKPHQTPYNIEHTSLSPDGKLLLRYGSNVVSVYEVETGNEIQKLFDPELVKYNKKKELKRSGLGEVFWAEDSKGVYALDEKSNTMSFWKIR